MADPFDTTPPTGMYSPEVLNAALMRISSQGLWLLLSLDRYGWRIEYDVIRVVLESEPPEGGEYYRQHAPLLALGHHFALTDKLWRLVYGIRAHRAGREFLNTDDGYLTSGYKYHRKLAELGAIAADEWATLLAIPSDEVIRATVAGAGGTGDDAEAYVQFAHKLPPLLVMNMQELNRYVGEEPTIAGPRDTTMSLRALDGQHRHGAPVVYHQTSPTESMWTAVDERTAEDHRGDTVGLIAMPPDIDGRALINLVKYDAEMIDGLKNASAHVAELVSRLVDAHLLYVEPRLVEDPLAPLGDYDL
jgi:hypothetical protein